MRKRPRSDAMKDARTYADRDMAKFRALRKRPCHICGNASYGVWVSCANDKAEVSVCAAHDIELNLDIMKRLYPKTWSRKVEEYIRKVAFDLDQVEG